MVFVQRNSSLKFNNLKTNYWHSIIILPLKKIPPIAPFQLSNKPHKVRAKENINIIGIIKAQLTQEKKITKIKAKKSKVEKKFNKKTLASSNSKKKPKRLTTKKVSINLNKKKKKKHYKHKFLQIANQ